MRTKQLRLCCWPGCVVEHDNPNDDYCTSHGRDLPARLAALEALRTAADWMVSEAQDHMRETGECLPRELDLAYLGLDDACAPLRETPRKLAPNPRIAALERLRDEVLRCQSGLLSAGLGHLTTLAEECEP